MEKAEKIVYEMEVIDSLVNAYDSTYFDVEPGDKDNQFRAMLMLEDIFDKIKHLKKTVWEEVGK